MEERRTRIRAELHQMLVDDPKRCCNTCKYGTARSKQYSTISADKGNGPLQMLQKPISSLLEEIEESMPSRRDFDHDLRPSTRCNHPSLPCRKDGRSDFINKLKELKTAWALSYEAVRSMHAAAGNTK